VDRLAVSADGRSLLSFQLDGAVGVWNLGIRKLQTRLTGATGPVGDAALSSDGKRAVTVSGDGTIRAWDTTTGAGIWSVGRPGLEGRLAAFSPDDRVVVAVLAGKAGNPVVALDAATGRELRTGSIANCQALAMHPESPIAVLAVGNPNAILLWDIQAGEIRKTFRLTGVAGEIRAIDLAPDGRTLVVGGGPRTASGPGFLVLLDAETGSERLRLGAAGSLTAITSARFAPDGRHLVTAGPAGRIQVWDVSGGRPVETFEHPSPPVAALFASNGRAVVSGGRDGSLLVWPLADSRFRFYPLPLGLAATATSQDQVLTHIPPGSGKGGAEGRILMPDWAPRQVGDVPFVPVPPREGSKNVIVLRGLHGPIAPQLPLSATIPVRAPASAIHILGACGAWAWPGKGVNNQPAGSPGTVALTVRLHFADGTAEDHPLRHGIEYTDWVYREDLPGSTVAVELAGPAKRYLRLATIRPDRPQAVLKAIQFIKSPDDPSAPVVVAVTVEVP
jgi:WD40 repeat protein